MSKSTSNRGKKWTQADKMQIKKLVMGNTPTRVMGLKLKRTPVAIQNMARKLHVSLKPVNQKPYSRKKGS